MSVGKRIEGQIFKTNKSNYGTVIGNDVIWFEENGNILKTEEVNEGLVDWMEKNLKKVRSDANIYGKLKELDVTNLQTAENLTKISSIKEFPVFLNEENLEFIVQINGKMINIENKSVIDALKVKFEKLEKIKIEVESVVDDHYRLSDRVLLYGPTGTGKTYDYLATVNKMLADGEISDYDIVTVTDGFEDIDFLAHVVPQEGGGIKYAEKKVVDLLRRASKGEKVAILIDELNRGSKSFLNLVLKMLDAVNGDTYVIDNFIADEKIIVPIENILFFSTMNLGGKYVGTSALDEALFDRFNVVKYKGYNLDVEDEIAKNFGGLKTKAKKIINDIRELSKDGEIRAPISTRGIKVWAEAFVNTDKSEKGFVDSFQRTILYRLTNVDDFGNPNEEEQALVLKAFKDQNLI